MAVTHSTRTLRPRLTAGREVPAALQRHLVYAGGDPDVMRHRTSGLIAGHRLTTGGTVAARLFGAQIGRLTLSYVDYGAPVRIGAGADNRCYCVNIPLGGFALVRSAGTELVTSPSRAVVTPPGEPLDMRWANSTPHLVLRIDRALIDDYLGSLRLRHSGRRFRIEPALDLRGAAGLRWSAIIELLFAELLTRSAGGGTDSCPSREPDHTATVQIVEMLVVTSLLREHPNNFLALAEPDDELSRPAHVWRAVDTIHDRLGDQDLTVATVATEVGVGVRGLQAAFAKHLGESPSAYIRRLRLEHTRDELSAARPDDGIRVADVAHRWHFTHLGRFSHTYQSWFGELPSETLHRRPRAAHAG